jgi:hypothetical protein
MALVVQKTGSSQGNANTVFYPMGNAQYGSAGTAVFRDITSGSNIVPKFPNGTLGYSTTTAYDLVTGLGSVDGATLVNNWGVAPAADFTIGASPTGVSVQQGAAGTSTITTAISGGFNTAVALSASGQPAGVTVSFSPTSIAAPGSGTSTMTMTVGAGAALGTTTITITATGGGKTHTATVDLTVVPPPDFSLSANPTSLTVGQGSSGPSTITSTIVGSFNAAVALSASGMPSGVTVAFVPSSIAAPGSGTSTMTVTAAANATLGNSTITITGTGGGKTHTATVGLTVTAPSSTTAQFVKTDTTTQGNWTSSYGADGYNVLGDAVAYPAYAVLTPSGETFYTWAASTTDVRALQKVSASDRIAATWYSGSTFTIDLNLTDGNTHQLALYCLDWDSIGRVQTITLRDAQTAAVLDSRSVTAFSGGKYLVWNVSGRVIISIANNGGTNAVLSGIFFH